MAKKNILIVTDKLDYHGASINGPARYYSWILKEIDKEKFDIWLCSLRTQGSSHDLFAGCKMLYLNHHKYYPFSFINIISFIRMHHIDLLHLSGYASDSFGRLSALVTKTPVIIQEHWVDPNYGGIVKVIDRIFCKITDRAIAVSQYSKDFLVNQKGIPEEKVRVVLNGIPLKRFFNTSKRNGLELKQKLGLDVSKKVIGIVGMLHKNKGHLLFIGAAAKVIKRYGDAYFVIVGEGKLRGKLVGVIADAGLQRQVLLIGQQDDMPAVMQMLDVFTICSYVESASLSLMEAMASGVAIVTTDCGGPSEMIKSGENGLVVPVGDSEAMANGLISLLENDDLGARLGHQARKDSCIYDISRVAREIEEIYEDVINRY